jgi:drug/metabolite transporter (DMT)-like permease
MPIEHQLRRKRSWRLPAAVGTWTPLFCFAGGALGPAVASFVWAQAGWGGACVTGLGVTALAFLLWARAAFRGRARL